MTARTPPVARVRHAVERTTSNGGRALAALRGLGSLRYPGGVDPVTSPGDSDSGTAGPVEVRGWALGRPRDLAAVVVLVDDEPAAIGIHDPSDPRTAPEVAPWCATLRLAPGRHVVGAIAVFRDGRALPLDHQVAWGPATGQAPESSDSSESSERSERSERSEPRASLEAGDLPATVTRGYLEEPTHGAVVPAARVPVSGWAAHDPVARIEIAHGATVEAARQMARPRADVALQVPTVHAGFCGFEHVIDLRDEPVGAEVRITATAVDPAGRRTPIGTTIVTVGADVASCDDACQGDLAGERPSDPSTDPSVDRHGDLSDDHSGDLGSGLSGEDDHRVAVLRRRTDAVTARHLPSPAGPRILAVTHDLGLGGGQLYLQELLLRLRDLSPDHECLVVSPTDGPLRDELEAAGIEVHIVGPFPTDPLPYEALLRELAFIAGDFGATSVVVNTAGAMGGIDLAERIGVPALWAVHESYAPDQYLLAAYGPGGAHPSTQARFDRAISTAAAIIFEAEATRQLYAGRGVDERLLHIDYGIPIVAIDAHVAAFDRAAHRRAEAWSDQDIVVLCVGTLEPRKAQGSLLRAFAQLRDDHPEAVLVLVGDRGDDYGRELRAYAERLELGDRVRIEPVRPDCYDWYASADAFVLASDLESLPRSVLEAMAFGLPVAAADVFGLSELIDDGETGVLLEPRDLVALEAALRRVLTLSAAERRAMGERGGEQVRARHDSRHYARAYRDLLVGLTEDPTARPGTFLGR